VFRGPQEGYGMMFARSSDKTRLIYRACGGLDHITCMTVTVTPPCPKTE
jgi:hypothetical protein